MIIAVDWDVKHKLKQTNAFDRNLGSKIFNSTSIHTVELWPDLNHSPYVIRLLKGHSS